MTPKEKGANSLVAKTLQNHREHLMLVVSCSFHENTCSVVTSGIRTIGGVVPSLLAATLMSGNACRYFLSGSVLDPR
eukprot:6470008-Amphidinium_carterae.2